MANRSSNTLLQKQYRATKQKTIEQRQQSQFEDVRGWSGRKPSVFTLDQAPMYCLS